MIRDLNHRTPGLRWLRRRRLAREVAAYFAGHDAAKASDHPSLHNEAPNDHENRTER